MKQIGIGLLSALTASVLLLALAGPEAAGEIGGSARANLAANLDLPYNAGGEDEEEEDAPEVLLFYGDAYEADAIVFCLDESLSMNRTGRWEAQKREVIRTIAELSERTQFGVVFYGAGSYAFRNQLVEATGANKEAASSFVNSRQMSLGTCLGPGVVDSLRMLQRARSKFRSVIVAGDGRPTSCPFVRGSGQDDRILQEVLAASQAANPGKQARIHTILVGADVTPRDERFMRDLANLHGGTFRRVIR